MDSNTLVNVLHNLHHAEGSGTDYARGLLVGIITGLMATGMKWADAAAMCSRDMPRCIKAGTIPQSWIGAFGVHPSQMDGRPAWERSEGR